MKKYITSSVLLFGSRQKLTKTIFFLFSFFIFLNATAQAPQKMSYQAVIRNASNALVVNTSIGMRISILQSSASGTPVFVETQTTTTNANGLASIAIGSGTPVTGSFTGIDWANGLYFIKTETDPTGGTSYTITGTSQLLSVPYALSSGDNKWVANAAGINNISSGSVGIGTPSSLDNKLTVLSNDVGLLKLQSTTGSTQITMDDVGGTDVFFSTTLGNLDIWTGGNNRRLSILTNGDVGIGTNAPTTKLEVNGFTKLGSDAPAIKVKKFTGTTSADQNGFATFLHGLTTSKIISATAMVEYNPDGFVPSSYRRLGYEFEFYIEGDTFYIWNSISNSAAILSKPFKVLITYEE
jgi:hypothetical protein